jgi:hypothetical protein
MAHCRPSLPSGFGALRTTGNLIIRWRLHEILHRWNGGSKPQPATKSATRYANLVWS